MLGRILSIERAETLAWWSKRGRNDAHELGFEYYDGHDEECREAYLRAFTDEKRKIQAMVDQEAP